MSGDDIPRPLRILSIAWPIGLSLLIGGATMVRATTQIDGLAEQVTELKQNGSPIVRERLARIEAKQDGQIERLKRIEETLLRIEDRR